MYPQGNEFGKRDIMSWLTEVKNSWRKCLPSLDFGSLLLSLFLGTPTALGSPQDLESIKHMNLNSYQKWSALSVTVNKAEDSRVPGSFGYNLQDSPETIFALLCKQPEFPQQRLIMPSTTNETASGESAQLMKESTQNILQNLFVNYIRWRMYCWLKIISNKSGKGRVCKAADVIQVYAVIIDQN